MEQRICLDSTPALSVQGAAALHAGEAGRDAAITRLLTAPNSDAGQTSARQYRKLAAILLDLASAVEAHRKAQQAFLYSSNTHDNRYVDTTVEQVAAIGGVIRAITAYSLADLRCRTIYLWPGSLKGEVADDEFVCPAIPCSLPLHTREDAEAKTLPGVMDSKFAPTAKAIKGDPKKATTIIYKMQAARKAPISLDAPPFDSSTSTVGGQLSPQLSHF